MWPSLWVWFPRGWLLGLSDKEALSWLPWLHRQAQEVQILPCAGPALRSLSVLQRKPSGTLASAPDPGTSLSLWRFSLTCLSLANHSLGRLCLVRKGLGCAEVGLILSPQLHRRDLPGRASLLRVWVTLAAFGERWVTHNCQAIHLDFSFTGCFQGRCSEGQVVILCLLIMGQAQSSVCFPSRWEAFQCCNRRTCVYACPWIAGLVALPTWLPYTLPSHVSSMKVPKRKGSQPANITTTEACWKEHSHPRWVQALLGTVTNLRHISNNTTECVNCLLSEITDFWIAWPQKSRGQQGGG